LYCSKILCLVQDLPSIRLLWELLGLSSS
jgi:hypothetical protein